MTSPARLETELKGLVAKITKADDQVDALKKRRREIWAELRGMPKDDRPTFTHLAELSEVSFPVVMKGVKTITEGD